MSIHSDDDRLKIARYVPRMSPTPIPPVRWDASPDRCISLSAAWASHVIGVLEALAQPDTWLGTEAERLDAVAQADEIIAKLSRACEYEQMTGVKDVRVTDCAIEVEYTDNPGVWIPVGDLAACFAGKLTGAVRRSGDYLVIDADGDGLPDVTINLNFNSYYSHTPEGYGYDNVWGGCVALMDYIDERLDEVLTRVEAGLDIADIGFQLLDLNPVWELLPVNEILTMIADLISAGAAAIRAEMTAENREELACDLFCILYSDDRLVMTEDDMNAWRNGSYPIISSVGKWAYMRVAKALPMRTLMKRYELGTNNPDGDWLVLCECGEFDWIKVFRADVEDSELLLFSDYAGEFLPGVGIRANFVPYDWPGHVFQEMELSVHMDRQAVSTQDNFTLKYFAVHGIPGTTLNLTDRGYVRLRRYAVGYYIFPDMNVAMWRDRAGLLEYHGSFTAAADNNIRLEIRLNHTISTSSQNDPPPVDSRDILQRVIIAGTGYCPWPDAPDY